MGGDDAHERLRRVLAQARLGVEAGDAVRLGSYSNDAWRIGPLAIRVCWRGDVDRLQREADLIARLPSQVLAPRPVASGRIGALAWTATGWVPGVALADAWPRLEPGQRRAAVAGLAGALAALHEWTPDPELAGLLRTEAPVDSSDAGSLVGATINPLPLVRAHALVEHARALPFVEAHLMDQLTARLEELAVHDPFAESAARRTVVHGDAHLANVLWRDDRVVGLLDFEWARLGPPDLDVEPLLRSVNWSGRDLESMPVPEIARLLGWLAADHPGMFAGPDLIERLWLYQLTSTLRELHTWPITAPADRLSPDHPLNHLPIFLRGPQHLQRLLAHVRPVLRRAGRATTCSAGQEGTNP